jgi:hypothetical protein
MYSKCPRIYLPNLSAQAQKFCISVKKGFIERPQSVHQNETPECRKINGFQSVNEELKVFGADF